MKFLKSRLCPSSSTYSQIYHQITYKLSTATQENKLSQCAIGLKIDVAMGSRISNLESHFEVAF